MTMHDFHPKILIANLKTLLKDKKTMLFEIIYAGTFYYSLFFHFYHFLL